MNGSEFSKSLLKSSKIDAPLPSAKTRALAHIEQALNASTSITNAAASTTNAITSMKLALAVAATALAAGSLGVGGGYAIAHMVPHERPVVVVPQETNVTPNAVATGISGLGTKPELTVTPPVMTAVPAGSNEPEAAADSCKSIQAEASNKCSVDGGRTITFAVRNDCSQMPLDFFFVDQNCKEVFRGIVLPGRSTWWDSTEGWVFRVRDHATHKLVKEFLPTAVEGAPDEKEVKNTPQTDLPLVTVGDDNETLTEAPPPECSHGGGRAAAFHVQNDRKNSPIAVSTVNLDCQEGDARLVLPGKKFDMRTSEGYAFRVRDSAGLLLLDIPPTGIDTTTYLTVP